MVAAAGAAGWAAARAAEASAEASAAVTLVAAATAARCSRAAQPGAPQAKAAARRARAAMQLHQHAAGREKAGPSHGAETRHAATLLKHACKTRPSSTGGPSAASRGGAPRRHQQATSRTARIRRPEGGSAAGGQCRCSRSRVRSSLALRRRPLAARASAQLARLGARCAASAARRRRGCGDGTRIPPSSTPTLERKLSNHVVRRNHPAPAPRPVGHAERAGGAARHDRLRLRRRRLAGVVRAGARQEM